MRAETGRMGNLSNCMSLDETDELQAMQEAGGKTQQIPPEVETFTPIRHRDIVTSRRSANSLQEPSLKRVGFQKNPLELGSSRFTDATSSLRNIQDDRLLPVENNSPYLDVNNGLDAAAKARFKQSKSTGTWDSQSTGSPGTMPARHCLNMTFKDMPAVAIDEDEEYKRSPEIRCSELDGWQWNHRADKDKDEAFFVSDGLLHLDNHPGQQNYFTPSELQNATLHTPNFPVAQQKGNITLANGSAIQREDSEGLKTQSLKSNLVRNCYKNLQLIETKKPKMAHRRLEPKSD